MERTKEEKIAIANEILRQLGGHKFIVMTGANNCIAYGDGLSFRIPGTMTKNHINYVKILLDPSDTYTVKFQKIRMTRRGSFESQVKTISEHSMIYDDGLQQLFTAETGLDTHL
jgi:hypothetical protein